MGLGAIAVRAWRGITDIYPTLSLRDIKNQVTLAGRCLVGLRELRAWHAKAAHPEFADVVSRHPLMPVLGERPYLNSEWSLAQRMRVVEMHHAMLSGSAAILRFPMAQSVTLASLDYMMDGAKLVLDKPYWMRDEGEVTLNLFVGTQRVYSLVFTLGALDGGRRVAYVGALQGGRSGDEAVERIRELTHAAHGMRPRDLTFAAFRMLCGHLGVEQILAVTDRAHVARSTYRNSSKTFFDYDAAWTEYGGTASMQAGFYEVPVEVQYREPKDVPARKRALYRRRYEMLRNLDTELGTRLESPLPA